MVTFDMHFELMLLALMQPDGWQCRPLPSWAMDATYEFELQPVGFIHENTAILAWIDPVDTGVLHGRSAVDLCMPYHQKFQQWTVDGLTSGSSLHIRDVLSLPKNLMTTDPNAPSLDSALLDLLRRTLHHNFGPQQAELQQNFFDAVIYTTLSHLPGHLGYISVPTCTHLELRPNSMIVLDALDQNVATLPMSPGCLATRAAWCADGLQFDHTLDRGHARSSFSLFPQKSRLFVDIPTSAHARAAAMARHIAAHPEDGVSPTAHP